MYASVIIPVCDQSESLRITLRFFSHQTYPVNNYEIVLVDDGSSDGLEEKMQEASWPRLGCKVKYIRQENQGRAIARNNGVHNAEGEILIFCDADRFPGKDFVRRHVENNLNYPGHAVIGCPWDYLGIVKYLIKENQDTEWDKILKFSRKPLYYLKLSKLFNDKGLENSGIAWAAFLVGNASLSKKDFCDVCGFDSEFKSWGFEHFELALRLQKNGIKFISCPDIDSYHIPHPRKQGYYRTMIESSVELFVRKHPEYPVQHLKRFLFGEISLQQFEKEFDGVVSKTLGNHDPIFYTLK